METLKDVFVRYKSELEGLYGVNEIEAITLLVISEVCELSKAKVKAFPETSLSQSQEKLLAEILTELKTGKPVQYVLGRTEFYGLPFYVNPSVLIPRPETEELVEWVIASAGSLQLAVGSAQLAIGSKQFAGGKIMDIGTGSGCIAIGLKKYLPAFEVSAIDISPDALKTAEENAVLNQVDINFIEADILKNPGPSHISNLIAIAIGTQISIIVSNPPYVTLYDKTQMHTNVTDFEPHTALFVPEDDPLIFYKAIADFAVQNLEPNGLLFLEINENYGEQTVQLLAYKGFKNIELRKDISGRDRIVKGVFSSSGSGSSSK
jgi:release factor glutamine methyltransferase